jgi:Phage integrase SAM-like domain
MKQSDISSLVLQIHDRYGISRTNVDFGSLDIHVNLAMAFKDSFEALTGQNSLESRRQTWRCIRKFAKFLNENDEPVVTLPLSKDILERFRKWLTVQQLNNATRQSHMNDVKRHIAWISRNTTRLLNPKISLDVPTFSREEPEYLPVLERPVVKDVLKACYTQIDEVLARMEYGKRVLAGEGLCENDKNLHVALIRLLSLGNGRIPTQAEMSGKKGVPRKIINSYGLRNLRRLLEPTPEDVFPFYLAILIQCSGNPMAIRELKRDCVRPHPLRDDRRRIVWMKERSGREQGADFSVTKPRSAPNLIEQVLRIGERLSHRAKPSERDLLFLASGNNDVTVPCHQMLHNLLDPFIVRNKLPAFDFKQFRTAGAVYHVEETGEMGLAQSRLNHRSRSTTASYVQRPLAHSNDRLIHRFQGELIQQSTHMAVIKKEHMFPPDRWDTSSYAGTVFGFNCRDPFAGVAEGTTPGKLCMKFEGCATCPGAIVVLDDVRVIARLLKTCAVLSETHNRAVAEGWEERFRALYNGIKVIVEEDLLAKVNPHMIEKARALMGAVSVPVLE